MTLENIYLIAQVVAALAIVASLVFVGLQLQRQLNEQRIARVTERARMVTEINGRMLNNDRLRAALLKSYHSSESLTDDERMMIDLHWASSVQIQLITFAEMRNGHIDPEFQVNSRVWTRVAQNPDFARWWRRMKPAYGPAFQAHFEEMLAASLAEAPRDTQNTGARDDA